MLRATMNDYEQTFPLFSLLILLYYCGLEQLYTEEIGCSRVVGQRLALLVFAVE